MIVTDEDGTVWLNIHNFWSQQVIRNGGKPRTAIGFAGELFKLDCCMVHVGHALSPRPIVTGDTDRCGPTQVSKKCTPFRVSTFEMLFPTNLNLTSWRVCKFTAAKLISNV
jgi:hypothetical protein